jgi:hypothetical protein
MTQPTFCGVVRNQSLDLEPDACYRFTYDESARLSPRTNFHVHANYYDAGS